LFNLEHTDGIIEQPAAVGTQRRTSGL